MDIDTDEDREEKMFSKEIVVDTERITNDDGEEEEIDKIEEVQGRVIQKTVRKIARWELTIDVQSRSNNCKVSDTWMKKELISEIEEITFEGDERAIPNEYKGHKKEVLESDSDMADELIDLLYDRVRSYLF